MRYQNRNDDFPVNPGLAYQGGYPQSIGGYQQQMPMTPYPYGMQQPQDTDTEECRGMVRECLRNASRKYHHTCLTQNNFGPYPPQPQANMGSGPQQYGGTNPYNQLFQNPLQPKDGYQYEKFGS